MSDRKDRLFQRAEEILSGRCNGFGEPILWHLTLRKFRPAMLSLACRMTAQGKRSELGRISDPHSPAGLMYRAWRSGEPNAAQNMAMTLFWLDDLAGYRKWLRRAARLGDTDALAELRRFEIRQPYTLARRLRRLRPFRRNGS